MMRRSLEGVSGWFPLFYLVVVGGGLTLLGWQAPALAGTSWLLVGVWFLLLLVTDAAPVRLPGGGYITVSSTLDYAGILILGPVPVALAELVATLVLQLGLHRRPVHKAVFNAAAFAGTVLLAGGVYQALGGVPGAPPSLPGDLIPLAGMGLAYYALNQVVVSLAISLTERRRAWHVWQVNYLWTVLHMVASIPFGVLFAVAFAALGLWGVVLFILPLLLARFGFKLYVETRQDLQDFAATLAGMIDEWDPYTKNHSERVSRYSEALARELGLPEREVELVRFSGLLHDIGKVTVSQYDLVTKPGPLTPAERARICDHASLGATLLQRVRAFRKVVPIVRFHHERMDGNGYHRVPRDEVPIGSRIVMVADAFDAMTTDRVYRKSLGLAAALEELRRHADTQFDPAVVAALHRLIERGDIPPGASSPQPQARRVAKPGLANAGVV